MKKRLKDTLKKIAQTRKDTLRPVVLLIVVNLALIFFQLIYLNLRFTYINTSIPLWYTKPWGDAQLAPKDSIFYIPATALIITTLGAFFALYVKKLYFKFSDTIIAGIVTSTNILLTYSLFRIIQVASTPFKPLLNPTYTPLLLPFGLAFLTVYIITPKFIELAKEKNLVTDPLSHRHPGMILTKPSARGGGVVFTLGLLITSLIFINLTKEISGILMITTLLALLGLVDDYQNTHPKSKLRLLENPHLRLALLFLLVFAITLFGIKIDFVNNPFNGIYKLEYIVNINGIHIEILSTLLTTLWIVWILNLLSWSNGIDGQYSGIVGIVSLVIALLALRFVPLEPVHQNYAKFIAIVAGASLGLAPHTWHPSKIMWGFGAMASGFCIATISIAINSKIATSIIILLVPFLDAFVTFVRRIIQKKNPLKGDRGHLHHLLLDRGWSVPKIALFYWVTTAIFGIIGLLSTERLTFQTVLMFAGAGAFFITLLNLRSLAGKHKLQEAEK